MSPLEIDTATPFYNVMDNTKQQLVYTPIMVQSPIFTDDESRRSSYYSYNSDDAKHKSLPTNQYELLYPTKKSAYDRIEYLEEKMKYQKDMNQNVIQQMSQSIDDFISSRKPIEADIPLVQLTTLDLDIFNEFIQIVFHPQHQKIVDFIESNGVTSDKMTKEESSNVLFKTMETERDRFVQECTSMLDHQHQQELLELKQTVTSHEQEKREMEQVVDEMQQEMETMMIEIDQLKQMNDMDDDGLKQLLKDSNESLRAMELAHLELKRTLDKVKSTFEQQVEALQREKEELRGRLVKAELTASNHHQKLQENTELEKVLQRTVAQKDAEAAKITYELEKLQKQYKQLQETNDRKLELQVQARLDDLESNLKKKYQKERDLFELQHTRDTRQMAGHITELETELENAERQHHQDLQLLEHIKKQHEGLNKTIQQKASLWEKKEHELKQIILNYDQKLISLEKEVLVLYTKNIELVESIGQLES